MKWRGRAQSVNVIDLRAQPKKITLLWFAEDPDYIVDGDPAEFIIDTDGIMVYLGQRHWTASGGASSESADFSAIGTTYEPRSAAGMQELYISFIPPRPMPRLLPNFADKYYPTLSTGQKYVLKLILGKALQHVGDKTQISIYGQDREGSTYLAEYAQNLLNNL